MVRLYHYSKTSKQFRKAIKQLKKQGKNEEKLIDVLGLLRNNSLTPNHNDHALHGQHKGKRECHIEGDWVLVYRIENDLIVLLDTGTHAEVFGM